METVHLSGAEDVRAAGNRIAAAADDMRSAASTIDSAIAQQRQTLDQFAGQFERSAALVAFSITVQAEIAGMHAENYDRMTAQRPPAYVMADFAALADKMRKEMGQ